MGLKINPATVAEMADAIQPFDTEQVRDAYRRGDFPRADKVKDLDKRYRWDLLAASGFKAWRCYDQPGVDDTHIDSVLRSIVAPLGQ